MGAAPRNLYKRSTHVRREKGSILRNGIRFRAVLGGAALSAALCASATGMATTASASTAPAQIAASAPQQSDLQLVPARTSSAGLWYYFRFRHSGKCITVKGASTANGGVVNQYTCVRATNQRWQLRNVGGFYFQFVNWHSGKCMDILARKGSVLKQWRCYRGQTNHHQMFNVATPWLRTYQDYALDVKGASQANNAPIISWNVKRVRNQYITGIHI